MRAPKLTSATWRRWIGRLPDLATTRLPQIFELERAADIADQEFLRVLVGEAAAGVAAELRERLLQLLVGDAEGAQRGRVGRHAVLAHFAAHRDDLRHARNGQQARPHDEVGDLAHAPSARRLRAPSCAMSRIWPMMELIGPICGVVLAGSWPCTSASRSATCWRLRKISVPQANST